MDDLRVWSRETKTAPLAQDDMPCQRKQIARVARIALFWQFPKILTGYQAGQFLDLVLADFFRTSREVRCGPSVVRVLLQNQRAVPTDEQPCCNGESYMIVSFFRDSESRSIGSKSEPDAGFDFQPAADSLTRLRSQPKMAVLMAGPDTLIGLTFSRASICAS